MSLWYFVVDGKKFNPMEQDDAIKFAMANPTALGWSAGMEDWLKVTNIKELYQKEIKDKAEDLKVPNDIKDKYKSEKTNTPNVKSPVICDEIDYQIFGNDMQFVEIELDPKEMAIAEAGAMMYKDDLVEMQTLLGDGTKKGMFGKLLSVGRRVMTGEDMFITAFLHKGVGRKAKVAFSAPYPGHIIPIALPTVNGKIICQKDAFLCASRGVSIKLHFQKRIMTALFGGHGFVMQKLEGDGMVFIHAGGATQDIMLRAGEGLHVDTGCLVALEETVDFSIELAGGVKSQLFGGEGVFVTHLKGPGRVWLQSMPFSRFVGRIWASLEPVVDKKISKKR